MRINSDSVLIEQAYLLILYNINNWLYETKKNNPLYCQGILRK